MSSEPAGNFGSCGSPWLIETFCNPRSRTRLRRLRKYSGTTSLAMTWLRAPTIYGQPYGIIAATRANVRDCHPGFDGKQTHELAWFAGVVALLFIVPDRADDVRDWAIGRKGCSIRARLRQAILR